MQYFFHMHIILLGPRNVVHMSIHNLYEHHISCAITMSTVIGELLMVVSPFGITTRYMYMQPCVYPNYLVKGCRPLTVQNKHVTSLSHALPATLKLLGQLMIISSTFMQQEAAGTLQ